MAFYGKNSPWYGTEENSLYLGTMKYRNVPKSVDDSPYVIETQYRHRPDLLAYDMYGDPKLWWVFVLRNRSVLKDPIYDFEPGVTIYVPRKEDLFAAIME